MIGAAVHDPKRRFATVIYRTAKGSLDHVVGGGDYPGLGTLSRGQLSGRNTQRIPLWLAHYISAPPDRLDVVFAARCVRKLFPQLAHENVNNLHLWLVHA